MCLSYTSLSFFFIPRNLSPSALRKAQDSLSDPKYSGKRVSRAYLLNDDEDEHSSPADSQVEDSESDDESQPAQEDDESDTPEPQVDVPQTINHTRQEDQKKGLAVSRQLVRLASPFSYINLTH